MKQLMNVNTRLVANANDPNRTEKKKNVLLPLESSEGAEIMKTWGQIFKGSWTRSKRFVAALRVKDLNPSFGAAVKHVPVW